MRPILTRIKPTSGFASFLHLALVLVLPIAAFILVSLNFVQLALSIIVLSKWRMFAVRPRFWAANVRANAVDLMVGISIVLFMTHTASMPIRITWAVLYAVWLLAIKPASEVKMVAVQAFIGQLCAMMALYLAWASGPIYGLTFLTGLFCFLAARHFLEAFDEPYARLLSYTWGYFGAALAWVLSHWLVYYRGISLPTLLLSCLGYGMAVLYYLDHFGKLSKELRRQFVMVLVAIVLVVVTVLTVTAWSNKVV